MQAENETRLRQFIEEKTEMLLGTLRFYVARAGLATTEQTVRAAADELLNEVVVEALEHAGRFRPDGQPRAWLLGIAANLIKRRQADLAKRQHREPLVRDLHGQDQDALGEDELFDRFAVLGANDPAANLETDESVAAMLAYLSESDRLVIRLAVLGGLNGRALAQQLGVSPGAARVRLHRALSRLRYALQAEAEGEV